ncbi:MAG: hypothetical protein L3J35_03545 [Bacteroidales bacterium]|nr:hypothetical protein [Bacteroidales bacterium]
MGFQDLKKKIQSKFPIKREIENTNSNTFFRGELFKKEYYNDYCYVKLRKGYCELSFFQSDNRQFEKIEDDYLDFAINFKIKEEDYPKAEKMIDWFV